jgi:hypothetical protein
MRGYKPELHLGMFIITGIAGRLTIIHNSFAIPSH